jgi:oligoendopeptidase F
MTPLPSGVGALRGYVPRDLVVDSWEKVEGLYGELERREVSSAKELEKWLLDFSELTAVVDETASRLYIAKTCHTEDEGCERRFMNFVENIEPKVKPEYVKLQKKYLVSAYREELEKGQGGNRARILTRKWRADVELFRTENVGLEVELTKLVNEFQKVCGGMMVEIEGKEYTMPQVGRFLEEPDRGVRERAWRASADRRLKDREKLDSLFDGMMPLREAMARNAGKGNFREYVWAAHKRFDYGVKECEAFHMAVERHVVPLMRKLDEEKAGVMGLEKLRPWDTEVDPLDRAALRPFEETDIEGFVAKTHAIFGRLSSQLAGDFDSLRVNKNLDLDSRKGKAPGGYQSTLDEVGQPFIFMNAAGMHGDVETLLHEGGHAFHALAAKTEPLVFLRHAPIEFCEVASMSMELLGCEHFDILYKDPADIARAKRQQLEGVIRLLPWVATVDAFQHWIYTHPGHTAAERTAAWLEVRKRFMGAVDFSGLEEAHAAMWQRQLHIFELPFYYIEYGIAQLGALQLWLKSQTDLPQALSNYRYALSLGGTRALPELFSAAGLVFDFSEKTVAPLVEAVSEELGRLPA